MPEISIKIYLNRDLEIENNFDKSKDDSKVFTYNGEIEDIDVGDLISDVKSDFRRINKNIKSKLRNKSIQILFVSYLDNDLIIEDDDDLHTEIDAVTNADDQDNNNNNNLVELRVIFHDTTKVPVPLPSIPVPDPDPDPVPDPKPDNNIVAPLQQPNDIQFQPIANQFIPDPQPDNDNIAPLQQPDTDNMQFQPIPIPDPKPDNDNIAPLQQSNNMQFQPSPDPYVDPDPKPNVILEPPQMWCQRIGRYINYKKGTMSHNIILTWYPPNDNDNDNKDEKSDMYTNPNDNYLYDIREVTTNSDELKVNLHEGTMYNMRALDCNTQYEFQIRVHLTQHNNIIQSSIWSQSIVIRTPVIPNSFPAPKYVTIVTLLHNRMFIKFDPGIVPNKDNDIQYWIKEKNEYGSVPFGVTNLSKPYGPFKNDYYPLKANTWYQIIIWYQDDKSGKQSLESKPLFIKTPVVDYLNTFYKPQPPAGLTAEYESESNEILLHWPLPKNTWGDLIEYEIKINNQINSWSTNEFPVRVPVQSSIIEIKTVTTAFNKQYFSEIGFYEISMKDPKNGIKIFEHLPDDNKKKNNSNNDNYIYAGR